MDTSFSEYMKIKNLKVSDIVSICCVGKQSVYNWRAGAPVPKHHEALIKLYAEADVSLRLKCADIHFTYDGAEAQKSPAKPVYASDMEEYQALDRKLMNGGLNKEDFERHEYLYDIVYPNGKYGAAAK